MSELLHDLGYSLQANRKTLEGTDHPDRNAQFSHLNAAVQLQLSLGEPVISVDTKKKELVGPFANKGRELRPKGDPQAVLMHDFVIPELGRAAPYGVYDLADNAGWVSVGTDHDTAAFAVETIRRWWTTMGGALSRRPEPARDRRCRRQQRLSPAALEVGAPEACRRDGPCDQRLPLSTGHEQVEQDRASPVQRDQRQTGGARRSSATR